MCAEAGQDVGDRMTKYFRPQKDITAYEAAYLLGHMAGGFSSPWNGIQITQQQWDDIPEEMKRHYSDTP